MRPLRKIHEVNFEDLEPTKCEGDLYTFPSL